MRLRKWVKVTIAVIIFVLVMLFADIYTKEQINNCIKAGHDKVYCETNLR